MTATLTISERRYLEDFLKSVADTKVPKAFSHLFSGVISIIGLILFSATVAITLNNFSDKVVYWVLFPGTLCGIGIMSVGFLLLKLLKKTEDKKKMATIISKLLAGFHNHHPGGKVQQLNPLGDGDSAHG